MSTGLNRWTPVFGALALLAVLAGLLVPRWLSVNTVAVLGAAGLATVVLWMVLSSGGTPARPVSQLLHETDRQSGFERGGSKR